MTRDDEMNEDHVDDTQASEAESGSAIMRVVNEIISDQVDRPRGIFTHSDREFLVGEKQYEHKQSRSNKLRDIRGRATNGILDLQFLLSLPPNQRKKILSEMKLGEFHESVASLVAFAYTGLDENIGAIEQMVESGLYRAARWTRREGDGPIEDVEVDINVVYGYDADEIYERWKSGETAELTPAEIGILVREGKLEPGEYEALEWTEDERQREPTGHPDEPPWYHGEESE